VLETAGDADIRPMLRLSPRLLPALAIELIEEEATKASPVMFAPSKASMVSSWELSIC